MTPPAASAPTSSTAATVTPRRRRETVCPYLRIDGQPARPLTSDESRTHRTIGPIWLQRADRWCLAKRGPVGVGYAFDTCLSGWSRTCPERPDSQPDPTLTASARHDLRELAFQLARVCELTSPFADRWRSELIASIAKLSRQIGGSR